MAKFTKVPNELLDRMAEFKPAAFKLAMALVRLTVGYHRDTVTASITELSELTGLSRQGVVNAAKEITDIFSSEIQGKTTSWSYNSVVRLESESCNSVVQDVQLSSTDYATELYDTVQQSSTITSGLKKERNIKDKFKDDDPIEKLETQFTQLTGLFSAGNYSEDWKPVLEYWHQTFGADAPRMMARAVEFARGDNPQAKMYTIRSPKSISSIIANMPRKETRAQQNGDGSYYV